MDRHSDLYLGRELSPEAEGEGGILSYPLDHLTTHALLLGATGSGKTGLGLALVEEVLRQGVSVLLLDVKGDLANLLLTFPNLAPADFAPWIDTDAARRQGLTELEAASVAATQWRAGLAEWALSERDIAALRESADLALYTPGAQSGRPVDILARFSAPPDLDPDEQLDRAQGLTSALLSLAGVDADPVQSREHILLTTLVRHAWNQGIALDIAALIQQVQQPPIERVGVFDLESFFPGKERFGLALTLNNLIAAPGFARWRMGTPLDMDAFLNAPDGRARASVFYLAHLPEVERRFFVTLFLEELRSWMRRQAGTRALRALLYFDEVYGYLPPYPLNPPPKGPLLALVKQGRAAGLGVMLATQNPGDLDYKSLGNIGTWFVGALRTDRDRERVMEGMEGAIAASQLRPAEVNSAISRLRPRLFLVHNAQEGTLRFFRSRWAMSYLRGPLTLLEAQRLTGAPERALTPQARGLIAAPAGVPPATSTPLQGESPLPQPVMTPPPVLDPAIPVAYLRPTVTAEWAFRKQVPSLSGARVSLTYRPFLLGVGLAHLYSAAAAISLTDTQVWRVPVPDEAWHLQWAQGEMIELEVGDLASALPMPGIFEPLPAGMGRAAAYPQWVAAFRGHLLRNAQIRLWHCAPLKLYSHPEENKRAFLERCRAEAEARKRTELDKTRQAFERRMARLDTSIRREELELGRDSDDLSERRREEVLSGAESVVSLFSRRRLTHRPLSNTSRQRRYVKHAQAEVEESEEMLKLYEEQAQQLEADWQSTAQQIIAKWNSALDSLKELIVRPQRSNLEVKFCGLAWFPFWSASLAGTQHEAPAYAPSASIV